LGQKPKKVQKLLLAAFAMKAKIIPFSRSQVLFSAAETPFRRCFTGLLDLMHALHG